MTGYTQNGKNKTGKSKNRTVCISFKDYYFKGSIIISASSYLIYKTQLKF